MEIPNLPAIRALRPAWNTGRIVGQKRPLKPKHVWAIRVRLELAENHRDLALFNLAIDSKLRGCDLVKMQVVDVMASGQIKERASVRADVLVVLGVPLEVSPRPGAVAAPGLIEHRDVGRDLAINQPAQHGSGAVGGVRDQAFRMQIKPGLHPIQHGPGRSDLGLPDGSRGFDIDNHTMIRVDQVVVL